MSEIDKIKKKIEPVAKKYNLKHIWLFGSYAKNMHKKTQSYHTLSFLYTFYNIISY